MAEARSFLDVTASFTGRHWVDRLERGRDRDAQAIAQNLDVPDIVGRILAARGITAENAAQFLDPRLRDLMPDPSILQGIGAAADRIITAIEAQETVALFGDYDVDGASSVALMAGYLRHFGITVHSHIPDRIIEGYGPNAAAIAELKAQGATLLVTLDCGTVSFDVLGEAQAAGLDTIVIDHHQAEEALPDVVAVVNPNRQDDLSGLGTLCAAGVAFMVLTEVARRLRTAGHPREDLPDLLAALDLVALATVADVVPLTGLNRAFVSQGLKVMARRERPGLAALMTAARTFGPPSTYALGFLLGPRINAGGRIGDAALGVRLLMSGDESESLRIAGELDRLNAERQALEKTALAQAIAEAEAEMESDPPALVVSSPDWHPGIVGLIAARLKERFRRPAFAIGFADGDTGTRSARSISGIDVGQIVRQAVHDGVLNKGGGHAMAAGVTIERPKLGRFRDFLNTAMQQTSQEAIAHNSRLPIDAAMTAASATVQLLSQIERAGPFGQGNPEPVVAFPAHRLVPVATTPQGHLRLSLRSMDGAKIDGIAFGAADGPLGQAIRAAEGRFLHVCGRLRIDRYQGREKVNFQLVDAADRPETD